MTPAWLPLVGVVIGAFIGGGAQIVANLLTRGEGRRQHRRDLRSAAYAEMLASVAEYARHAVLRGSSTVDEAPESFELKWGERLTHALNMVSLVGPVDTYEAAQSLEEAVFLMDERYEADELPHYGLERVEFVRLAKRDLGLDQPELSFRQRLTSLSGLGWLDGKKSQESERQG